MISYTCKLQLLSIAVLCSFLSVGISVLMLLTSGCWQDHRAAGGGSVPHIPPPMPHIHGEWQMLSSHYRMEQHRLHADIGEQLRTIEIVKKIEQERAGDFIKHNTVQHSIDLDKYEVEVSAGRPSPDNENRTANGVRLNETKEDDWPLNVKPVEVVHKHKRLSKKRLQAIRALGHNSSASIASSAMERVLHHHKVHSQGRNRSSHHMVADSYENRTNMTSIKLVPISQQMAISHKALCPHPSSHSQCTEFLPHTELAMYKDCQARMAKWQIGKECQCQFMNTSGHSRVALVSLPGSGNTWLRGLLEKATGVCTGSLFCDKTLRAGGMCGEGLREGVLVVKTHDTRLQWTNVIYKSGMWSDSRPFFDAAVLLVRSPFRAMIAEWNRQNAYRFSSGQRGSSHVKYLESSQYFMKNPRWEKFINEQIRKWKMIVAENMLKRRGHPVFVVYYEQLKTRDLFQVQQVLEFLQFPFSKKALTSAVQGGFSSYYRNHTDSFQHFTQQQTTTINNAISETVNRLKAHNFTEMAKHLNTYLDL